MKELAQILAAYEALDTHLEQERAMAGQSVERVEIRQILNDQAYFVLCWGQLENEINSICRTAISRRRLTSAWATRRGWDLYNPDDPRLSGLAFEDRTRLVLDAQEGRSSPYAKVMGYYEMRNRIAHGTLQPTRIAVQAVVKDFYVIQSALHRAA